MEEQQYDACCCSARRAFAIRGPVPRLMKNVRNGWITKRQRKNRKRINRLVEHWPELFNREKPQPLKVEIPDDLIQDIAIRELAFGAGTLHAAVASYV